MSGILGIVHFDGRPADGRHLVRMSAAAAWRAVDGEAAWVHGPAAIGHQHARVTPESMTEEQPFVSPDVVVSFDGRLDNRDELTRLCARGVGDGRDGRPDAALVARTYEAAQAGCAGLLAGDFAFALFDRQAATLCLARDVMGARPLFYAPFRNGIAFASEIKSLLAHPAVIARPDDDGLADLVLNGFWDGHRTWFDGIWSVPPGAIVTASARGITVARAWDFDDREIRYSRPSEYVEHFRLLFAQAVKRRLRSAHPVAVAVSGGVDSSAIHCEAARLGAGVPIRGFTLAYPRGTAADERDFIGALRRQGLSIDEVGVESVRWLVGLDQSVARTEMPSLLWDVQDALLARAREAGCRVLLHGFFADQLLAGQAYLVDLAYAGRWRSVGHNLHELASWMADVEPRLFRRQFVGDAVRAAMPLPVLQRVRRTIGWARGGARYPPWFTPGFRSRALGRALDRSARPRRLRTVHAQECWRRATSGNYHRAVLQTSSAGVQHHIDTAYPYRDRDLVAFLIAVPGDVISQDGVPKGILRHAMARVLPDEIRLRRSKGDGTPFSNQAALAEEQTVRRRFDGRAPSARAGFVDPSILQSRLAAIFGTTLRWDGSAEAGWQIGDTLALDLWLERFCNDSVCH